MNKIYKQILVLIPFVILFSSCVDITRNIVVNKDGSGKETMDINISSDFFKMMRGLMALDTTKKTDVYNDSLIISEIKKNFKGNDLISLGDIKSTLLPDSSKNLLVDYSFKDLSALASALDGDDVSSSKSKIYMKEQGNIIKFYYEMANEDTEKDENSMSELNTKMFENKQFTLSIDFPYDVISSNATTQSGRKLTWIRPMTVISKPGSVEIFEAELKK